MQRLKRSGNSLVVVEHDPQVMQAADRILDVGPGPGEKGGEIVFFDAPARLATRKAFADRGLPAGPEAGECRPRSRSADRASRSHGTVDARARRSRIRGARQHNLKNIDVAIPLNRLVCITGVSGSGKVDAGSGRSVSGAAQASSASRRKSPGAHERSKARTPRRRRRDGRSDADRTHHAFESGELRRRVRCDPQAVRRASRSRGSAATRSARSASTRATVAVRRCGGNGFEHVEMQFLSDVYLRCADCNGRRYRAEILEVTLNRGERRPGAASRTCST